MSYLEPGAYSQIKSNLGTGAGPTPAQMLLIMGSGASVVTKTETITRASSGDTDTLPMSGVTEILSIGYTEGKTDFVAGTDYNFSVGGDVITWTTTGKRPNAGDKYVITVHCTPDDTQYLPRTISQGVVDIENYCGAAINPDGSINRLSVCARIVAAMGVGAFYVLQVKPNASSVVNAAQYQLALDSIVPFIPNVYRIVPADLDSNINAAIDGHIALYSSYEERLERVAIYAPSHDDLVSFDQVMTAVGNYASSKANSRVMVPYPDRAIYTFPDGVDREVDGSMISAALAALATTKKPSEALTRSTIGVFKELLGVQMRRTQKNQLAEEGVCILEQNGGPGTNVAVRHGITTDMSSIESREQSIQAVKDYVAKYIRSVSEPYIGKYNITADLITRLKGSLDSALAQLIQDNVILTGVVSQLKQDANNADTLLVEVTIGVPFPCNYIKIVIVLD